MCAGHKWNALKPNGDQLDGFAAEFHLDMHTSHDVRDRILSRNTLPKCSAEQIFNKYSTKMVILNVWFLVIHALITNSETQKIPRRNATQEISGDCEWKKRQYLLNKIYHVWIITRKEKHFVFGRKKKRQQTNAVYIVYSLRWNTILFRPYDH